MIQVTGTREIRMNPVTTVPRMAPAVPTPERRPTTVPVSARLLSRSVVTMGVIAESSSPGTMMVAAAVTSRRLPPATEPAPRRRKGVAATTAPLTPRSEPSRARASRSSAQRPPSQAPPAMAASASPMTRVLVSRVRPR